MELSPHLESPAVTWSWLLLPGAPRRHDVSAATRRCRRAVGRPCGPSRLTRAPPPSPAASLAAPRARPAERLRARLRAKADVPPPWSPPFEIESAERTWSATSTTGRCVFVVSECSSRSPRAVCPRMCVPRTVRETTLRVPRAPSTRDDRVESSLGKVSTVSRAGLSCVPRVLRAPLAHKFVACSRAASAPGLSGH